MKYLIFLGFFLLVQSAAIASGITPSIIKPVEPVYGACNDLKGLLNFVIANRLEGGNRIENAIRDNKTMDQALKDEEAKTTKKILNGYNKCNEHNADLKKDYDSALADYNKKVSSLSQEEQWQLHNEQHAYKINSSVDEAMGAYDYAKVTAEEALRRQTEYRKKRQRALASVAGAGLAVYYGIKERNWRKDKEKAAQAADSACELATNLSASGAANCTEITPATPGFAQMADDITLTGVNANCFGSPADCDKSAAPPAGTNLNKTPGGLSSFAAAKPLFKVNPDGSITTKDGKKLTSNSFASEGALVAAGFSPADAKKIMADIKKSEAEIEKEVPLKAFAHEKKSTGMPLGSIGGEAGGGKTTEIIVNGDAAREKELLGSTSGEKREVASVEGLAKDFNGEQIGVAGDDIFKMMNRRYKFKTSHDDFIAP